MHRAVVAMLLLVSLAACVGPTQDPEGPTTDPPASPAVRLVRSLQVDTKWSGEPSILALDDGTLLITGAGGMTRYAENPADAPGNAGQSYIWRSTDGGANWTFVDLDFGNEADSLLPYRSGVLGVEGDLATDGFGTAYFVDLTMLATQGVALSLDHGATWANAGAPAAGLLLGTDRPWIAADALGPNAGEGSGGSVVVKYLQLGGAHRLAYLQHAPGPDRGTLVMVEDRELPSCGQTPIAMERTGGESTDARVVMACTDGGLSLVRAPAYFGPAGVEFPAERIDGPKGQPSGGIGAVLAAGQWGTPMEQVYAFAWGDSTNGTSNVRLALSLDDGTTWQESLQLNPENTTAVFPWVDISGNGTVGVTWYQSPGVGDPDTLDGAWVPMHAFLQLGGDGSKSQPILTALSDHVVHEGPICTQGLNCVLDGRSKERRLLDFFEIDVDDAGVSHVTWTDNSEDVPTIWYGQVAPAEGTSEVDTAASADA